MKLTNNNIKFKKHKMSGIKKTNNKGAYINLTIFPIFIQVHKIAIFGIINIPMIIHFSITKH